MKKSTRTSLKENFRIKMKWAAVSLIVVFAAIAQTQVFAADLTSDGSPYGLPPEDPQPAPVSPQSRLPNPPPPRVPESPSPSLPNPPPPRVPESPLPSLPNPRPPRVPGSSSVQEPHECQGKSKEEIKCMLDELKQQNDAREMKNSSLEDELAVLSDSCALLDKNLEETSSCLAVYYKQCAVVQKRIDELRERIGRLFPSS
jgi:hypothetical protein